MDRMLMDALEAIHRELLKIEFYGQAAEDNLERLQGTVTRAQHAAIVGRLDHAVQSERELTRSVILALEAVLQQPRKPRVRSRR